MGRSDGSIDGPTDGPIDGLIGGSIDGGAPARRETRLRSPGVPRADALITLDRSLLDHCLLWDSPEKAWYRRVPP